MRREPYQRIRAPGLSLSERLEQARKAHADGRFAEAVTLYAHIIKSRAGDVALLSLAGLAAAQAALPALARDWLAEAAKLSPRDPAIRANLAGVHLALGQPAVARDVLRDAVRLSPNDGRLLMNLGHVEEALDDDDAAIAAYETAAALAPNDPTPLGMLGRLHHARARWPQAVDAFGRARRLRPDDPPTLLNHAAALEQAGQLVEAMEALRHAAALSPTDGRSHARLGTILLKLDDHASALSPLEQAVALIPDDADTWLKLTIAQSRNGLHAAAHTSIDRAIQLAPDRGELYLARGNLHWDQRAYADAAIAYERATALRPDLPEIWFNRGNAAKALGDLDLAQTCFLEAVRRDPENPTNHCQLSHLYLSTGRWHEGFQEAEWRWRLPTVKRPERVAPVWAGETLVGKRIVIRAEQGYGDTIQFVRMTRELQAQSIFLEVQTPLVALLRTLPWPIDVLEPGTLMPEVDYELGMMSLPAIMGFDPEQAANAVPYLRADPVAIERWRKRVPHTGRRRVGLAGQGNPDYLANQARSLAQCDIDTLLAMHGIDWYPVQPSHLAPDGLRANDHTAHLTDFAETAALLANLDLVISVDTAVAHLAGAMGRAVWMLDRFDGDWRWLRGRTDTIWYPTMRLFRQTRPGDWTDVLTAVCAALTEPGAR